LFPKLWSMKVGSLKTMTFEGWSIRFSIPRVEQTSRGQSMHRFQYRLSGNISEIIASRKREGCVRSRVEQVQRVLAIAICMTAFFASPRAGWAQVPTYEVTPEESSIKFGVDSSVSIKGNFEKWNASIKFSSRDIRTATLDIEIEAGSVNTGSHMKDNKLKRKDFFNAKESPTITFKST